MEVLLLCRGEHRQGHHTDYLYEGRIADIERASAPCEVCRKLHQDDLREETVDMYDWWVSQANCTQLISYDRDILKDLDDEDDDIDDYDY